MTTENVLAAADGIIDLLEEHARYHVNLMEAPSLANELRKIVHVMNDAESQSFNYNWLSRLEQTLYQMEDVLDECNYEILKFQMEEHRTSGPAIGPPKQKLCSFIPSSSCLGFKKVVRLDVAKQLLNVKEQLDAILKDKDRHFVIPQPTIDTLPESWRDQSTHEVNPAKVHGRGRDMNILVSKLVNNSDGPEGFGIKAVSIVGMGGLGKTTLAQLVYNHKQVEVQYKHRIWVCASGTFDPATIAIKILESINGSSRNTNELDDLFVLVQRSVSGKILLFVLDDVRKENCDKWKPLLHAVIRGGSRVLMTTRNVRVAEMMGITDGDHETYYPGLFSDKDCWWLLSVDLSERKKVEFEEIGKEIAKKCCGLPLVAVTLRSLLQFKSSLEEWENVLNGEIWKMEEVKDSIFPSLLLSYNELSPTLKLCFTYCAVFPKDCRMDVETLIESWTALGYLGSDVDHMEKKGREFFDVLAMQSLLLDFEENDFGEVISCKMHSILHDFSQFVRKSRRMEVLEMKKSNTCRACDPSQVSSVKEFRGLYFEEETPPNLCDCLRRLRVLSLEHCGLRSIPQGTENLIQLRWLNMTDAKLSCEDLKIIFQLYHLQTLTLLNCGLEEIPREIGNLIHLRRLELSNNSLKELPEEICRLVGLRRLNLSKNESLKELPREIWHMNNLRHLNLNWNRSLELPKSTPYLYGLQTINNLGCKSGWGLPVIATQITGPDRSMTEFRGGNGWCRLGLLKNLNHLDGVLWLRIRRNPYYDPQEVVMDAREAKLKNKSHIEGIRIHFDEGSSSIDILDALQPHPNLKELRIWNYQGYELPIWMVSPDRTHLRNLNLHFCNSLTSLPDLGKLPCLEEIYIDVMSELEIMGRDFLGITTGEGGGGNLIAFPKLKTLELRDCGKWKKWDDITEEEEESSSTLIMPCLTKLAITGCYGLTALPHRLLRKASSLEALHISGSTELLRRYQNKDDSYWKSISINNSRLHLICDS